MGFKRLESDSSIYLFAQDDARIIMPVYIDDITIVSSSNSSLDSIVSQLKEHFKLRDLGPTQFLLGIEIAQNIQDHSISLS